MANTYTQLHIHFIFAVQNRNGLIMPLWKEKLHQYITALIHDAKHKMIQVNSMPDHIHLLVGLNANQSISSMVQNIKSASSLWINTNGFTNTRFCWQEGYAAFACSKSALNNVIRYIQNQEVHHRSVTFCDEYKAFLKACEIDFDVRYVFTEPS